MSYDFSPEWLEETFYEWLEWNDYNVLELNPHELADLWDEYYAQEREAEEIRA